MLTANNISYSTGGKKILKNISINFLPGEINMILGPNGSGKSTFIKVICEQLKALEGEVFYNGINVKQIPGHVIAQYRAVMSQQTDLFFPLTVSEVVTMGRYPHFTYNPSVNDKKICNKVMAVMNLQHLSERNYTNLSGGEKQRVQFARVLAQIWDAAPGTERYLLLDEPLTSLDMKYQLEFLRVIKSFTTKNTTVVIVIHDINLAALYADKVTFFKDGEIIASGFTQKVLTPTLIKSVYNINGNIISDHKSGIKAWINYL